MSIPELTDWAPIHVTRRTDPPVVEWCQVGKLRFRESFFEQTTQLLMQRPFNLVFRQRTPLDVLVERATSHPGLAPTGLIFHMSRCGSTLVSQMLAKRSDSIVLSEPAPLDAILRFDQRGATEAQRIAWLRGWVSAMGQPRNGERYLFLKLDAWHAVDLPLLRRAFPSTPWVFLYRNPVEVMVSALKSPSSYMIPGGVGQLLTGLDWQEVTKMSSPEYCARILHAICSAALEHLGPLGGRAIDYQDLPGAVMSVIAPHFGLTPIAEEAEKMYVATAFHAKAPQMIFENDIAQKQKEASPVVREICAQRLYPLYAQLRTRSALSEK